MKADLVSTNVARAGGIIESSTAYNTSYPVSAVIDGNVNEGTNATPISYWITAANVPVHAYFTLDLRGSYPIDSIVLYNTHNRQYYERGTGPFVLYGSSAVQPWPPFSGQVDRYYTLDGNIADQSTNSIQATMFDVASNIIAPTFSADAPPTLVGHSRSLSFSGAGEHLDFVDTDFTRQPSAYSISAWVKLHVVQKCVLIMRCTPLGGSIGVFSPQLRVNAAGNFEVIIADSVTSRTVIGTTVIQPETWYHVAVTAQINQSLSLYVNGMQEGSFSGLAAPLWAGGDRWNVGGAVTPGAWASMNGQMADLAIWYSAALTPAMVSRLANSEPPATVVSTPLAGPGQQLVNPQVIASGSLTQVTTGSPTLLPQTFTVSPAITARYLQFRILGGSYPSQNLGLNEIQVVAKADNATPPLNVNNALFLNWPNRGLQQGLQTSPTLAAPVWSPPVGAATSPTLLDTDWGAYVLATNSTGFYRLISH